MIQGGGKTTTVSEPYALSIKGHPVMKRVQKFTVHCFIVIVKYDFISFAVVLHKWERQFEIYGGGTEDLAEKCLILIFSTQKLVFLTNNG